MRCGINSATSMRNSSEKATPEKASYLKGSALVARESRWMKLDARLALLLNSEKYFPKTPGKSSAGRLFSVELIYASFVQTLPSGALKLPQVVLLVQTEAQSLPKRHLGTGSGLRPRRTMQTSGLLWRPLLN
jgi:hypothetical protein